ncbi:hypothetical protein [Sinomicrobium weinanense]|uniref:Uncharacterized protein n=1 Tax=Sinomicrobium weinanense TaxID=2842200 RepID=A0A926Q1P5_9FLAO|nr:hypothetical protein [Sinomicrobium weinanense]MBC9795803.1 hypothetical protein [Sinomicrobium weinanense]MBU3121847.1 hypothetical protein [Sinomicrobium weinanense]
MKNIGIWMDRRKAHLVTVEKGDEKMETVISKIEAYRPVGGSRSKTRWGPQDVVQDSKYTERRKHQMKRYFEALAAKINDAEAIAIYGPGAMGLKFAEYLEKDHKPLREKVKCVEKADSMTANQVKALVRDFFVSGSL